MSADFSPPDSGIKSKFIYIMAPSYTGSTLLTYLLAMHPKISTVGELKATSMGLINQYVCSCGSLITQCGFWEEVTRMANEAGLEFSIEKFGTHFRDNNSICDRLLRAGVKNKILEMIRDAAFAALPGCARQREKIISRNRQMIEIIKVIQGRKVFLDGSKDPNRLMFFLAAGIWQIKVIYLVRDGRGTTNSYMRHNSVDMKTAAKEWLHTHKECDRMMNIVGKDCIKIKYEELCGKPDRLLSEIFDFVGIDSSEINTDFRSVEHHILGNTMRLASTGQIRQDEKWKKVLTEKDLKIFERIAGKRNRDYGYQ